jgi:hypothetical protein
LVVLVQGAIDGYAWEDTSFRVTNWFLVNELWPPNPTSAPTEAPVLEALEATVEVPPKPKPKMRQRDWVKRRLSSRDVWIASHLQSASAKLLGKRGERHLRHRRSPERAVREDRSSISSRPLADLGRWRPLATSSSIAPHSALFLCSRLAAVPSSRPARAGAPRARGRQGWPSHWPCRALQRCQATP